MTYGTEITDNDKRELFIINQKQEVTKNGRKGHHKGSKRRQYR